MMKTVQSFINRVNQREHVLLLIKHNNLKIHFITKEQTISFFTSNGKIFFTNDEIMKSDLKIYGDCSSLTKLIDGRETLRTLMKRGDIRILAPFRTILLLESLFYLGKKEDPLAKIS